jgi:hypothetical protein
MLVPRFQGDWRQGLGGMLVKAYKISDRRRNSRDLLYNKETIVNNILLTIYS